MFVDHKPRIVPVAHHAALSPSDIGSVCCADRFYGGDRHVCVGNACRQLSMGDSGLPVYWQLFLDPARHLWGSAISDGGQAIRTHRNVGHLFQLSRCVWHRDARDCMDYFIGRADFWHLFGIGRGQFGRMGYRGAAASEIGAKQIGDCAVKHHSCFAIGVPRAA